MASTFFIVHPRGDKSRLSIVELSQSEMHEVYDYMVASRKSFDNPWDAHRYTETLASTHNKTYVPERELLGPEIHYLD